MRCLVLLIACVACAVPAQATVDPDVDQIGVYFDLDANAVCLEVPLYSTFSAYMIITNPSATEVQGVSVRLCAEGDVTEQLSWWYGTPGGIDYWSESCYCVTFSFLEPVPFVGSNVPLVRVDYLLYGELGAKFFLRQEGDGFYEDGLPAYIDAGGIEYPLGVSSGDPSLPVAVVNGDCNAVVSITGVTLGAVKSLYR
ncbi:MAG: hypothetical protein KOO60_14150 [Gemmatimonadales bacterium]|nr:hypothetical protein [Gemmatimonadales bacterium]